MAALQRYLLLLFVLFCASDSKKIVKEKHRTSKAQGEHSSEEVASPHEQRQFSLVVEHAVGREPFSKRGTVLLKSLKSSRDVTFLQDPLTATQVKNIQKAAATNDLYHIRTSANVSSTDDNQEPSTISVTAVSTFISACALMKSNFNDRIIVNGDGKGNVYGLTLLPFVDLNDDTECSSLKLSGSSGVSFSTVISYSTGETGPVPDTQSFIQKQEAEKASKETEDNRSFFQKYWLYMVIGFVAFQFLASSAGGAATGGGGGGGGQ